MWDVCHDQLRLEMEAARNCGKQCEDVIEPEPLCAFGGDVLHRCHGGFQLLLNAFLCTSIHVTSLQQPSNDSDDKMHAYG